MPTIDELPVATSVSDSDELPVSQSDTARKATRAQLLSGVQPALSVAQGTILGRVSAGSGSPEAITIGANLTLANATLSAPAAFEIAGLNAGGVPSAGDLVAVAQGGQNAAISYATFAAGLSSIPGLDATGYVATPLGGVGPRILSALFSDAITVESFGAVGDGVTDDTAAFVAAFASGRPIRLDGRIYAIAGTLTIAQSSALLGVPGMTNLLRTNAGSGGGWISLTAANFSVFGVAFDGGSLAATNGAVFTVGSSCEAATFRSCGFTNGKGGDAGHGLYFNAAGSGIFCVEDCRFSNNALDGLNVTSAGTVSVLQCVAGGNGGNGISIEGGIACEITNNSSSGNQIGIAVGNWQVGTQANGVALRCDLFGNQCDGNNVWGIATAGVGGGITGNSTTGNGTVTSGGGILCRMADARIIGNRVDGGATGVDVRTCYAGLVAGNQISNAGTGIAAGASQDMMVASNFILQNTWGVLVTLFEPSLSLVPTGPISIDRNWIGFTNSQGGGIRIMDGVQGTSVTQNDLNGWGSATSAQSLWIHTDSAAIWGNRWNNTAQFEIGASLVGEYSALVLPDVADRVFVTSAPPLINAVLTEHQVATLGQITFLRISHGGSGYTRAQAAITGSGSGAMADAVCGNGQVIGLLVTNPGSGYGAIGASATVDITGDGSGATAAAYVGLPVLTGRNLQIACNAPVRLTVDGASPPQKTWSQYDLTIPAFGAADLMGAFGGWYALQSPPVDYLAPTGSGGVVLGSVGSGDIFLRPAEGGALHFSSSAEPAGATTTVGRGAPTGAVAAPPGSDFRNLNGGVGNTFWIKCSGTDANGWVAIA